MKLTPLQLRFLKMAADGALSMGTFKPTEKALERRGLIYWTCATLGDGYVQTTYHATETGLDALANIREGNLIPSSSTKAQR